jgi:pimeloyl-ACP methyl ester carboxylesterase
MKTIKFPSRGVQCEAWHIPAADDTLKGADGRPCIVMAHGFGGTRDTGLLAFAEPFAQAGFDVLLFDYRGFGGSSGQPRQDVSYHRQRQDYHAAIAAARHLPGVDADRIVLWGTSYSGGHCIAAGAEDGRVAAVIAMNPAVDGRAALLAFLLHNGPLRLMRLASLGLWDVAKNLAGRAPRYLPVVGPPGSLAMMTTPGALDACVAMAGPTWRNEVRARAALEAGLNRPTTFARKLKCPILFQIGSRDSVAPPDPARKAAKKAGRFALTKEYDADHFDFYDGPALQRALSDQLQFVVSVAGALR